VWQRIYWAVLEGVVASALLLAGGLDALQTMVIASAFPMIFVVMISCAALLKALREDFMLSTSVQHHSSTVQYSKSSTSWKDRVNTLISHPVLDQAQSFLKDTVKPALNEVCEELKKQGLKAEVFYESDDFIKLVIHKKEVEDFFYGVRLKSFSIPSYYDNKQEFYCRAEVFLRQGGQRYDVFGYTQDQVSIDAVTQYEKHLHYLHLAST
jgi:choline/glycine/proline betaine transport protein